MTQQAILPIEVLSPGIAIGKLHINTERSIHQKGRVKISHTQVDAEIGRYRKAIYSSKQDLLELQKKLSGRGSLEAAQILDFHIEMLLDPLMNEQMENCIRSEQINPEAAFKKLITDYEKKLTSQKNVYIQQKASDVRDLTQRVLKHLNPGIKKIKEIPSNTIYFSHHVSPSEVASLEEGTMFALGSENVSFTSHAVLLARAKGIPFFSGIAMDELSEYQDEMVILDANQGILIFHPTEEQVQRYTAAIASPFIAPRVQVSIQGFSPPVELLHTIANPSELYRDGFQFDRNIGLFRTEFYALQEQKIPSEEEQYLVYCDLAHKLNGKFAIIRAFDFGKDKTIDSGAEHKRGLLWLLDRRSVLKEQLRALLRAAVYGDLRLLIPMVSCSYLLSQFMLAYDEVREELVKEGIPHSRVPIGCMIETPSALYYLEEYAKEVDFFSVGSNDLVQYFLGVDRELREYNTILKKSLQGIFRLFSSIVEQSKTLNKPLYFCGEMGSNPLYFLLLLGIGVKSICMPSRMIRELEGLSCEFPIETLQEWAAELTQGPILQTWLYGLETKVQKTVESLRLALSASLRHL